jgi:hypothetical protein
MAEIKSIYAPQVEADLKKVFSELEKHHKLIIEMSKTSIDLYGGRQAGNPAELKNAIKAYEELAQKQKELEAQLKKLTEAKKNNTKAVDENTKVIEREAKAYEREKAKLESSANVYTKIQAKLNLLNKEYSDLAAKKAIGVKISDDEAKRMDFLSQKITKYDQVLKSVDATMGKYQRNVGNYASAMGSGFNPLSNSIQQLTREMPAFTYSVQTGFMALSNNIPIFFDAMGQVIRQNKELQAQGQPTKSVLSQLAGAFFGWGTALSVGITLLTVYGKEIGEFLFKTESKKKAIEAEKKALEEKNEVEKKVRDQQINYANDELTRANLLLSTARNLKLSNEERIKAVDELQKRYPDYLGNLSKEEILAGNTAIAEAKLTDALMKRAIFLGLQDKIKETTKKLVESELDYNKAQNKNIDINNLYSESEDKKAKIKGKVRMLSEDEIQTLKFLQKEEKDYQSRLKKTGSEMLTNEAVRRQKKISVLEELQGLFKLLHVYEPYNQVVKDNTKATKDNAKAKEKQREMVVGSVEWLEAEISKLKELQRQQSTTTDEFDKFNAEINTLVGTLDLLINKQKEVKKQSEEGLLSEEDLAKLSEQMEAEADYFLDMAKEKLDNAKQIYESFGSDFIKNAGLTETFKILEEGLNQYGDNWEAKAIVIMEATQEMFNFIANLSQAHFAQEYSDLERQKEISIQFAGDSTEAREEIEQEYERRRKEIQIREAKAKRSQAIFNIGIDMAQAIMRAWAQNPITAPVFTAIIGALGVAQIAAVASQPLPQFWKGTDNSPEGFAEVGERGRELIKDGKSGQWRLADKKGVDYLTKGSTVLTNANTEKVLNFHAFNKGLTNTLVENNIDFYPIESKIDKLTNAILNKESLRIVDDSNGRRYYEEKNGQMKSLNNARLEIKQRVF